MTQLILTLLILIPIIYAYDVTIYVDSVAVSNDDTYTTVASTTSIKCLVPLEFSDPQKQLKLSLVEVSNYFDDTLDTTDYETGPWTLSVVLYGLTERKQLRCVLSDVFSNKVESHTANIVPSPTRPLPYIPYNTDRRISMGPGFTTVTTSRPTNSDISFGSTYIIYILVIVIFLSFLASTGAVACWLSARVRANRVRVQRAHAARIREIQEEMATQSDTVVLTHMQLSSRQNAPPPYEGAPINTTISLHIDSAPPCYQEALTQPQAPPQGEEIAPPPFEAPSGPLVALSGPLVAPSGPLVAPSGPIVAPSGPIVAPSEPPEAPSEPLHTSTHSLEISAEETDRLLPD